MSPIDDVHNQYGGEYHLKPESIHAVVQGNMIGCCIIAGVCPSEYLGCNLTGAVSGRHPGRTQSE
jgi:hypothetical protein